MGSLTMSDWKIAVTENQYRDEKYRVTVANFDELESIKCGVGSMGSAKYGLLAKEHAEVLAQRLEDTIDFNQHERLTDDLTDEIREIESDVIELSNI